MRPSAIISRVLIYWGMICLVLYRELTLSDLSAMCLDLRAIQAAVFKLMAGWLSSRMVVG